MKGRRRGAWLLAALLGVAVSLDPPVGGGAMAFAQSTALAGPGPRPGEALIAAGHAMMAPGGAQQLAQSIPGLPPRPEEEGRPRPAPRARPEAPPPLVTPARPAIPAPGDLTLTIAAVQIEGNTIYDEATLRPLYAALLGRPVPIAVLAEIEAAIGSKYRADGYILARAIVPAGQSLDPEGATIRVMVHEGYVDRIIFQDVGYEDGTHGTLIRDMLNRIISTCHRGTRRGSDGRCPLHKDVLERYLLLAGDLPGVEVNVVVQPSATEQGAASLFVTVSEATFEGNARVDNRGSRFVGPVRAEASVGINNVAGLHDRTRLRFQTTPYEDVAALKLYDLAEEIPIGSDGTRIGFAASYVRSRPGDALRATGFESKNASLIGVISHPIIRSRSENLQLRMMTGGRDAEGRIVTGVTSYDATRFIGIGATYDLSDSWLGITLVDVEFQQGLPGFGAIRPRPGGKPPSRVDGRTDFRLVTGQVQRLQRISSSFNLLVSARGQYSFSDLLASQEFALGGEQYGRAFDSGEVAGDLGFATLAELQWSIFSDPAKGDTVQLYGFTDYGWVKNRSGGLLEFNPTLGRSSIDIASAGVGIRFSTGFGASGYAELAVPLTDRRSISDEDSDPRVFVALAFRF